MSKILKKIFQIQKQKFLNATAATSPPAEKNAGGRVLVCPAFFQPGTQLCHPPTLSPAAVRPPRLPLATPLRSTLR